MDLDRLYLPHWQFSEHHQRLIDAPAAAVLDAVEDLLRFDDPLVRAFLVLREAPEGWPACWAGATTWPAAHASACMSSPAWSAAPTRPSPTAWSAASGAPTSPWNASRTASISAATTSPEWPSSCCVSVARPAPAVPCCTRKPGVLPRSRQPPALHPYWLAIRPVSGLIRRRLLAGIERRLG